MVAAIDPFRIIDAPAPISGKAAWTVRKTAVTWVRKTSSKSFSRVSSIGLNFAIPALANKDVEMAEFVLDPVEKAGARLRIQNIRFDGRHTQLIRSRGEVAASRPVIATRAPSATNRRAVARPIPLFPPVIRAVFPFNNIELVSLSLDIAPIAQDVASTRLHLCWTC
jgi:hypothetical protein